MVCFSVSEHGLVLAVMLTVMLPISFTLHQVFKAILMKCLCSQCRCNVTLLALKSVQDE